MCKNGRQPSTRLRLATTRAPADVHEAIQVRPVVALTVWLWLSADIVQAQARHEHVFSIEAHDCRGRDLRQTGFRTLVDGVVGIVTTLHGVVGCGSVEAENGRDRLRGLGITRVDVSRDAAFLSSDSMQGEGMLRAASDSAPMTDVEAVGPGASVALEPRRRLTFRVGHAVRVAEIVSGDTAAALRERRSPDPGILVFSLAEAADRHDFGAPILNPAGLVVGVENGVLDGTGTAGWVVASRDIEWTPPVQNETQMDRLAALSAPLW